MFENTKLAWEISKERAEKFLVNRCGQAMPGGNILTAGVTIISLLLVGFIGMMILQSTSDATGLVAGDKLYTAHQNLVNVTGTTFSMYGVLIIVLLASIIIGLLLSSFLGGKEE